MSSTKYVKYSNSTSNLLKTQIILKQYNEKFGGYNIIINNCLLDEGSTLSYIQSNTVKNTKEMKSIPTNTFHVSNTANQKIGTVSDMVKGNIFLPIYDYEIIEAKLHVLDHISHAVILGLDILGPIRKKMNLDPAYINNVLRNSKITYSDIMINIDSSDRLELKPHQTFIINKNNIYLKPFERKMVNVMCEPINESNFNICLISDMTKHLKIDRFRFKKDQNYLSLQSLSDKVICIRSGIPLAEKTDIIDANEIFDSMLSNTTESNNLLKVHDLPKDEQKIYHKEFLIWQQRRK